LLALGPGGLFVIWFRTWDDEGFLRWEHNS
jgi:hypothetical protein